MNFTQNCHIELNNIDNNAVDQESIEEQEENIQFEIAGKFRS